MKVGICDFPLLLDIVSHALHVPNINILIKRTRLGEKKVTNHTVTVNYFVLGGFMGIFGSE